MHQTEAETEAISHVYGLRHQHSGVVRLLWNFLHT